MFAGKSRKVSKATIRTKVYVKKILEYQKITGYNGSHPECVLHILLVLGLKYVFGSLVYFM